MDGDHWQMPYRENLLAPRLLVWERRGWWTAQLRLLWPGASDEIAEYRSFQQCHDELACRPASILAWEIEQREIAEVATALQRVRRDDCTARVLGLMRRPCRAAAALVRELGCEYVATGRGGVATCVRLARRHLELVPKPPETIRTAIWNQLPWRRYEKRRRSISI